MFSVLTFPAAEFWFSRSISKQVRRTIKDWLIFPDKENVLDSLDVDIRDFTQLISLKQINSTSNIRHDQWPVEIYQKSNTPASFRRSPEFFVLLIRSLPARSTRESWLIQTLSESWNRKISVVSYMYNVYLSL